MSEEMLVTQALDERELLVKKINDKIQKGSFVDTIKNNAEKVYENQISREEFERQAQAAYQQIVDLIARYQKIDAAIVDSNANTWIETAYGRYTVAGAISLRNRLREKKDTAGGFVLQADSVFTKETDFEGNLCRKLQEEYQKQVQFQNQKNSQLQATAEEMRLSILGRDGKNKEENPLEVVEVYIRENTTELADPLGVQKKIAAFTERRDELLRELETKIKVSNATTRIRI
ncbi:MAG TPA: hypothetical protein IAB31_05810 [Candidatus Choladousia intestinavium]|uniref:Uncharacterized protein n=1 Tax=Candidatus Choladousia intestinavium TaxID=2840727 RepID=A0A9D1ABE7_9FIRM|nr:hypothetical protein [Candidatus Choladousia intestinavium]